MPDGSSAPPRTRSAAVTTGESRFWTFSLAVYADPAVQQECLKLQDDHGVDVNLLLFCAFVGAAHGAVLSEQAVNEAANVSRAWQKDVVGALRAARRTLKRFAAESGPLDTPIAALRARVKELELDAERIEQAMLEHWAAVHIDPWPRSKRVDAVTENVRTLLAMSARTSEPASWPERLVAAALATLGQ
jgi:uncharacterized protein (TIGR02444 family)